MFSLRALALLATLTLCSPALAGAGASDLGEGWLGVALAARPMPGTGSSVVVATSVLGGSPAHSSGVKGGDVIVAIGKMRMLTVDQLVRTVRAMRPGTKVTLTIRRAGRVKKLPLLLGTRPDAQKLVRSRFLGKAAPTLVARNVASGKALFLSRYKGKVVLLDFWATWCGPCRMTLPVLNAIARVYKKRKLAVIGVSDEPPARLAAFAQRVGLSYTIAHDLKRRAHGEFLVTALPTMFLIDKKGVVRDVLFGAGNLGRLAPAIKRLLEE
ncbi:MAG: redoxin domain-containing protein [Myxococcales bacterium]|nr:redoxin domain-containing protein [Myxococcales bacterium]